MEKKKNNNNNNKKKKTIISSPLLPEVICVSEEAVKELRVPTIREAEWRSQKLAVSIKSDSMSALSAVLKLKSSSADMNAVVRELALDVAEKRYDIDVVAHISGRHNVFADELSRWWEPGCAALLPRELHGVPRRRPAVRGPAWWEAAGEPG